MEFKITPGSVVFFKRAKSIAHGGKKKEFEFAGHGYGVILGLVPPGAPPPPIEIIIANLGAIGYGKLDDIKEFLGDEASELFQSRWQAKYMALIEAVAQKALAEGALKLVGPDGKPVKPGLAVVPIEDFEKKA